jgi:hypothetical protein
MKIIAVHKTSDTVPYLICICQDYTISDSDALKIFLDNAPYRTDGTDQNDIIFINPDNWDWVDEWPLDEGNVIELQSFVQNELTNNDKEV